MPHTWQQALNAYRYLVSLRSFGKAKDYPGWFEVEIHKGDRGQTQLFEERFRQHAQTHIEAWYEVVFWKLHAVAVARNKTCEQFMTHCKDNKITASQLYGKCLQYIQSS